MGRIKPDDLFIPKEPQESETMSVPRPMLRGPWLQALCTAPLAWLWFVLVNELRVEWTVNPQYAYGWAAPFLCAYLLFEKIKKAISNQQSAIENESIIYFPSSFLIAFCLLLAVLYLPTRLLEEANPGWRLISWSLALEIIGITLCFLQLTERAFALRLSTFIFPICYFLVAVPWPTALEQTLIQGLTRADTDVAVEILGWLGNPAMPHGNVIEVATGTVGIDEACSGIRSFQATLMISLFLGELYALGAKHRAFYVLAGFGLSFVFNLARMVLLVWVAANQGIGAISRWHDPAGITILLACFLGLWGLGVMMGKIEKSKTESEKIETSRGEYLAPDSGQKTMLPATFDSGSSILCPLALALTFLVLLAEVSIEGWYRSHEARLPHSMQWSVAWPTNNPSFKELPLAGRTREILRYDEGRSVAWQENGVSWQVVFLRWNPGCTALHLAQNHTPEVCMTAAGHKLVVVAEQKWFAIATSGDIAGTNSLELPFAIYEVEGADRAFYLFYCLWNDRATAQGFQTMLLNYSNRLTPVLAGLRNPGQRSVEIAVKGPGNAADAETAVRALLAKYIRTK